ncbi:4-hydroxy-tetrahydrodipicolinate synthase [Aureibacter tunicatorum]|uniref:4-hydroxy-tetrahydrodipicolinate synthase n=1 Tax=Aureibacter tunicatorum TaxID=866807 RepID=A0AAE3XS02_9BACT|nr:4-hydroxy-tetrahydrodipicolinate synthase [Aureibacter tunicatorum]MDR6240900.1 4-hydroxy-tetrahydrodipicolinate synthase [Aureibacter tunicatorum]BDD03680.1 4-hydroxy-tetrahydrodipicolinate synthase [Aureibacter tunicatorum]
MGSLRGTGVALVTPFDEHQNVDYDGLGRLVDHVSVAGCEYLVVQGTTGESATMSQEEKSKVLDFVAEKNAGKLPIVYGIGGNNTHAVVETIKSTDLSKVDALLSVSPYYNKPSQDGILRHYVAVADASPVPVVLYNVPGRTGSMMSADTILKLAEHSNICGVKDASSNYDHLVTLAKRKPKDFDLISGDDLFTPTLIALGGVGAISVLANALPEQMKGMVDAALGNDPARLRQEIFAMSDINPLMYEESNPVGVKALLDIIGICGSEVRLPLVKASEDLKERIKAAYSEMKA